MEELQDQVKSLTKIVAELTKIKAREKVPSLSVLSKSHLAFINQEDDDVIEETPPQAPPSAITSPIIVPEPQVPQPLSAPLSLPTHPPPQVRSPLSTIDSNSQLFCSFPNLGPSDQQKQKVEAIVVLGKEMVSSAMAYIVHYSLTKTWLIATRLEVMDIENLIIKNFVFLFQCIARSMNPQCS